MDITFQAIRQTTWYYGPTQSWSNAMRPQDQYVEPQDQTPYRNNMIIQQATLISNTQSTIEFNTSAYSGSVINSFTFKAVHTTPHPLVEYGFEHKGTEMFMGGFSHAHPTSGHIYTPEEIAAFETISNVNGIPGDGVMEYTVQGPLTLGSTFNLTFGAWSCYTDVEPPTGPTGTKWMYGGWFDPSYSTTYLVADIAVNGGTNPLFSAFSV